MENYTTVCGVELPTVDPEKNYPVMLYKVSPDWEEFLRYNNPISVFTYAQNEEILEEDRPKISIHNPDFIKKIAQAACTMYHNNGIGIAANQVGFKENWCIIDTGYVTTGNKKPRVLLNPFFFLEGDYIEPKQGDMEEGCLSVPLGFKGKFTRSTAVRVTYTGLTGEATQWIATDLNARAVLHELDHLDGTLFIDHISKMRLGLLEKKIQKAKKMMKHKIINHNRNIVSQVKDINIRYGWSKQRQTDKVQRDLEGKPISPELQEILNKPPFKPEIEILDEQVSDQ